MALDELDLIDDTQEEEDKRTSHWTVLIVDDDREVHDVTLLALHGLRFAGRPLRFLHAYSGAEARQILREHDEIALTLLDVVMETDNAGLEVVEFIRNELQNKFLRIVLRTGQPGQAPEIEVITRYDINDYKQKTELTREKLFTTIYTGLAAYRDLRVLDANLRGLEKVVEASGRIFELRSMEQFAQGVIEQMTALLYLDEGAMMLHTSGIAGSGVCPDLRIVAASGQYSTLAGKAASDNLPEPLIEKICAAQESGGAWFGDHECVLSHPSGDNGEVYFFYVESDIPVNDTRRKLLETFFTNVAIAVRNVRAFENQR